MSGRYRDRRDSSKSVRRWKRRSKLLVVLLVSATVVVLELCLPQSFVELLASITKYVNGFLTIWFHHLVGFAISVSDTYRWYRNNAGYLLGLLLGYWA